jgi:2-polyprenyl-3-methyl-5-hydroxy-6-metoxy-1,4-benzoquinol methylase
LLWPILSRGVPCPVCKNISDNAVERFGDFRFVRCPECTLEFCDPLKYDRDSYDRAYKGNDADFYVPASSWLSQARRNLPESKWMLFSAQQNALKWIELYFPFASILDIGCGSGWFLAQARQMGFRVKGVEPGSLPVQILKQKGFEVECGSLEAIPENWQPDVVTLFEVLEHLPNPTDFLAKIRQRFQNSIFILSVPSPKRWTKGGRHRDAADYPPNHLTRWNTESLQRALSRAGYSKVEVSYPKPSSLETASVSIRGLMKSWFTEMPDALPDAIGNSKLRPLHKEITMRKLKCLPGFFFSNAFHFAGWSGISMLGIARP